MEYISTKEWGDAQTPKIDVRRVTLYANAGRIEGAKKLGTGPRAAWIIPNGAAFERKKRGAVMGNKNAQKEKQPKPAEDLVLKVKRKIAIKTPLD